MAFAPTSPWRQKLKERIVESQRPALTRSSHCRIYLLPKLVRDFNEMAIDLPAFVLRSAPLPMTVGWATFVFADIAVQLLRRVFGRAVGIAGCGCGGAILLWRIFWAFLPFGWLRLSIGHGSDWD